MPHGGCKDEVVVITYEDMERLHEEALRRSRITICGVDSNGSIGRREPAENHIAVGDYCLDHRNYRLSVGFMSCGRANQDRKHFLCRVGEMDTHWGRKLAPD